MATKTMKASRSMHYGTRMLQAGDEFEASGPNSRLYRAIGWAEEVPAKAEKPAQVDEPKQAAPKRRKKKSTK